MHFPSRSLSAISVVDRSMLSAVAGSRPSVAIPVGERP